MAGPLLRDRDDVVRLRLRQQRLSGKPFSRPAECVSWHLAMQSQDYAGAKWAVAQRTAGADEQSVEAALDAGKILRTHVLRPTWHFVAPADIRWLLALSAPRIKALMAPYLRKHGLDAAALKRSRRVIEKAVRDTQLTREELSLSLAEAGLPVKGESLSYVMMAAELDGAICSGARRGKQHTYALLEARVPKEPARSRDEALAELALRYLQSHGPALVQDLAWWSGLTLGDARRGVAACADQLLSAELDGKLYWLTPQKRSTEGPESAVHLLPIYDEQLIAYRYRGNAVDAALTSRIGPGSGIFDGNSLLVDGALVGSWRRDLEKKTVTIQVSLLRQLTRAEQSELKSTAQRYAAFLGLGLKLSVEER